MSSAGPSLADARVQQRAIGSRLKKLYDDTLAAPIPDEFIDILRRSDQRLQSACNELSPVEANANAAAEDDRLPEGPARGASSSGETPDC